ncbi:uncharacterized protein [Branchiostoma lanceolatum]|uniref:uncharacterized protein n=1 Tax=Branchiostoma lanceolatum TaxID=7740 RepID=UPI00345635A0
MNADPRRNPRARLLCFLHAPHFGTTTRQVCTPYQILCIRHLSSEGLIKTAGSSRSISCSPAGLLFLPGLSATFATCLTVPSIQARMANFLELLPVVLLSIAFATFIKAEQSWQSGANLEHYSPSTPGLATTNDRASNTAAELSSLADTKDISANHTPYTISLVDVVGTHVLSGSEPSNHLRESHNGGLKWMDYNTEVQFSTMEDAVEEHHHSQEKTDNVSRGGDSVLIVTINVTLGQETGFTTPSSQRKDALGSESTDGLDDYEATTTEPPRQQTVFCLGGSQRWTGLLRNNFNSIITLIVWQPCCNLFHLAFLSLKIGFCCAYMLVISAVILLCISIAFPSEVSNKLIQNYFLPAIIGMLVYLLGVLVLYAILPVICMFLVVVYRSITNWFPKMRLTSEETIARCTVELPMKVLSLALTQIMKKTTPTHFVNPQYQQQHIHFRRNRRCG